MTSKPLIPWTERSSLQIVKDRWIDLRAHTFVTGAGVVVEPYYVVHRRDWACILAIDDGGRAVAVRVWRQAIGLASLELPGGAIDAEDGSPAEAVRRELLEETGYACGEIIGVAQLATNPANHTNYMHVFAARGAHFVQPPQLEPAETLETKLMPFAELKAQALAGGIKHGLQVAAILLAGERLGLV